MKKIIIATMSKNAVLDAPSIHNAFNPHFHDFTRQHALILGAAAWDTWTSGAGRIRTSSQKVCVVVSKARALQTNPGAPQHYVPDLESAFELANRRGAKNAYIAGGAQLFGEALRRGVDELDITFYKENLAGDLRFPIFQETFICTRLPRTTEFRQLWVSSEGHTYDCTKARQLAGGFIRTLWERSR